MKTPAIFLDKNNLENYFLIVVFFLMGISLSFAQAQNQKYIEVKGQVFNQNHQPISEVHLSVENTNISGLTNTDGVFSLKIPKENNSAVIRFSKVKYETKKVQLPFFEEGFTEITLNSSDEKSEKLEEVEIYEASNPKAIVKETFKNKAVEQGNLIGFYREQIDRGRRNVMLGEAVVHIDKNKRIQGKKGKIAVYKSRKQTDYNKLDTLAVKLRGGPYTGMFLDLTAYPEMLFYQSELDAFEFEFENSTTLEGRYIYVIYFEQIDKNLPWYYGKLYIDAKTKSLVKADYSLNIEDRKAAAEMLVVQKPRRIKVTPLETHYQAEYVEKNGKWFFNYGSFLIKVRVNWKGKLFNARYSINTELAITDRAENPFFAKEELTEIKPNWIMSDDISGFGDSDFWGRNNIIHPDKSIQDVIESIQDKIKPVEHN